MSVELSKSDPTGDHIVGIITVSGTRYHFRTNKTKKDTFMKGFYNSSPNAIVEFTFEDGVTWDFVKTNIEMIERYVKTEPKRL